MNGTTLEQASSDRSFLAAGFASAASASSHGIAPAPAATTAPNAEAEVTKRSSAPPPPHDSEHPLARASVSLPPSYRPTFANARAALCADDLETAGRLFDEVAAALPNNVEVRLYAAWVHARLSPCATDDEREQVEELARRALSSHDSLALPLCVLAHSAVRRHDFRVARRLFQRAADADPSFVDARRGIRMMDLRLKTEDTARTTPNSASFQGVLAAAMLVALATMALLFANAVN